MMDYISPFVLWILTLVGGIVLFGGLYALYIFLSNYIPVFLQGFILALFVVVGVVAGFFWLMFLIFGLFAEP